MNQFKDIQLTPDIKRVLRRNNSDFLENLTSLLEEHNLKITSSISELQECVRKSIKKLEE